MRSSIENYDQFRFYFGYLIHTLKAFNKYKPQFTLNFTCIIIIIHSKMEIVHYILLWHLTLKEYDDVIYTTAGLGTQLNH